MDEIFFGLNNNQELDFVKEFSVPAIECFFCQQEILFEVQTADMGLFGAVACAVALACLNLWRRNYCGLNRLGGKKDILHDNASPRNQDVQTGFFVKPCRQNYCLEGLNFETYKISKKQIFFANAVSIIFKK